MSRFSLFKTRITNIPEYVIYAVFVFVMLVKGCYYGFRYNPVLDDFIQYHTNTLYENPFQDALVASGLLNGRPLAGIFDLYFWSNFWDNLFLANIIITLLYAASGIFIYRMFSRFLKSSPAFLLIYGLLPLGSEAANWLSASSRLIVPMFFLGISLELVQRCFDSKKLAIKIPLAVFGTAFLFAAMAFYEQITVVAFIMMCALILLNKRIYWHYLIVTVPSIAIACFYLLIKSDSLYAGRINLINLSALPHELYQHFMTAGRKIIYGLSSLNFHTAKNGYNKGLDIISADQSTVFIVLLAVTVFIIFFTCLLHGEKQRKHGQHDVPDLFALIFSAILIAVPMLLFLIIQNPWISMRNFFPPILGIALLIDLIYRYVLFNNLLRSVLMSWLCFVFLVANVGELTDYLAVGEVDMHIAHKTAHTLLYEGENHKNIVILGTKDAYVDVATQYNEHINNITSSDWAYEGAVAAKAETIDIPHIYHLHEGLVNTLYPHLDLDEVDAYYLLDDNFNLLRLEVVPYRENFSLYRGDTLVAEVFRWNNMDPTIKMAGSGVEDTTNYSSQGTVQ